MPSRNQLVQRANIWDRAFISSAVQEYSPHEIALITGSKLNLPVMPRTNDSIEKQISSYYNDILYETSVLQVLEAAAVMSGVSLKVSFAPQANYIIEYPLSSWLSNSESSLGEFAADIFTSQDTFDGLPLEYTVIRKYFELHQKGLKDYSTFLFPLLTLGVWNRLIQKR